MTGSNTLSGFMRALSAVYPRPPAHIPGASYAPYIVKSLRVFDAMSRRNIPVVAVAPAILHDIRRAPIRALKSLSHGDVAGVLTPISRVLKDKCKRRLSGYIVYGLGGDSPSITNALIRVSMPVHILYGGGRNGS